MRLTWKKTNSPGKLLFLVPLLFLFISCGKNKPAVQFHNIPADSVIPSGEMVKILADIHVVEASVRSVKRKGTSETEMAAFYYQRLFSGYHMSEKRFRDNLNAWQDQPEQFYKLYMEVGKELDRRVELQRRVKARKK